METCTRGGQKVLSLDILD